LSRSRAVKGRFLEHLNHPTGTLQRDAGGEAANTGAND
jgi:hypothetical protein